MTARYISLRRRSVPPVSPAAAFPKTICLAKSDRRGAMRSGTITLSTGLRRAPVSRGTATCSSCTRTATPTSTTGRVWTTRTARPKPKPLSCRTTIRRSDSCSLEGERWLEREHRGTLERVPRTPQNFSRIIWLSGIGTVARFRAFLIFLSRRLQGGWRAALRCRRGRAFLVARLPCL